MGVDGGEKAMSALARLASPDEIIRRVFALDELLLRDVVSSREALRRFLKGGTIRMLPQDDGAYVARAELLSLVVLLGTELETPLS